MIKVLMADDHPFMRRGIKQLLDMTDDIQVSAEASNGQQVIEQLENDRFDILLTDITMSDTKGMDLIEKVHALYSQLPILVLSMYGESQIGIKAMQSGALGYITKDSDPSLLPIAIRKVAGGSRYIDSNLAMQFALDDREHKQDACNQRLSEREREIMRLLAKGHNLQKIADMLLIERGTVSTYKTRMMRKMGFRNNVDLMHYAVLQGLTNCSSPLGTTSGS